MSPLWSMQSTAPHWTVMLEEVTPDSLTEVGAADGAENTCRFTDLLQLETSGYLSPASLVIAVTGLLAMRPFKLAAVTVRL